MARPVQEINAGSMADIAFLLLIFFLVTTTMDVDSGLTRKLPPPPEKDQETDMDIKKRNILVVLINKDDKLLVKGEPSEIFMLKDIAKEFISNPNDLPNMPEKTLVDIDFFGPTPISKQVISLQNDNGTSYGMYIQVQNELVRAYNELRDELATNKWGVSFDNVSPEKQEAIKKIIPQRISEAEPKNIGG